MNKKSNQAIYAIMGFVWIGLALIGLIFDPEKRVIIISLFPFRPHPHPHQQPHRFSSFWLAWPALDQPDN